MTSSDLTRPHGLLDAAEVARLGTLLRRSIEVIETNQSSTGAYLASPSFAVYRFSWLRDGSFIADAMSRAGRPASAESFFAWCDTVVLSRSTQIESLVARRSLGEEIAPQELLPCRYTVDGGDSAEDWWEFQLDGYGMWLWSLGEHLERTNASPPMSTDALALTVRYLASFWTMPCFDWWEENGEHRHTSTLAAIYGGLRTAAAWDFLPEADRSLAGRTAGDIRTFVLKKAIRAGRLCKWLEGNQVDASLLSCATPFRLLDPDDELMASTVEAIERQLVRNGGGVHRYCTDTYFGGGEWPLLAALLGWYYTEAGRHTDAIAQLRWVVAQATLDGDLPEQTSKNLLAPEYEQQWIDRWGPVATPLLWSHAMLLTLAGELGFTPE
jgi:GH15 family glucan-1,4-alpha-glucosidase